MPNRHRSCAPEACGTHGKIVPQGPAQDPGVFPAGEKVAPSGNYDSGSMAFTSITRISRRAVPDTWTRPPVFCHAIVPCVLSNSGKASDPEISPLISARLTGDTTMRLMAHSRSFSGYARGGPERTGTFHAASPR